MPTLEQLLNFFRDHALPTDVDPAYRNATVAGLPVCTSDDEGLPGYDEDATQRYRLLGYPHGPDNALFLPANQVRASSDFTAPNDAFLQRLLSATGGLRYEERLRSGGTSASVLSLCRDASPLSGTGNSATYAVYAAHNTILNHRNPGVPGLAPLSVRLAPAEIIAIVSGLHTAGGESFRIPEEHYAVNASDQGQLSLMPNAGEIRDLIAMIQSGDSPISAGRRAVITAGLNHLIEHDNLQLEATQLQIRQLREAPQIQRRNEERQDRAERSMRNMTISSVVVSLLGSLYITLIATGKAGPLHNVISQPFRGLFNLGKAVFDGGTGLRNWWWDLTAQLRYRGLSTALQVGDNLTEMARRGDIGVAPDESTAQVAERIERRINSPRRAGSAIVIAPPGWGKEVLMQSLAGRALSNFLSNNQISRRARTDVMKRMAGRNPNTIFIQTNANGIMAGTRYQGDLEERLENIPREITAALARGQRVILCIDEFHEILTAGRSEHRAVSLLEHWKGPLAKGTLRIVGFSTPDEMLKAYYEAGVYATPQSRARLSEYHRSLLDRWDRDPRGNEIHIDHNRRPLLNRFLRIDATPRPGEEMDAILNRAVEQYRADGVDINIAAEGIRLISRLSESPIPGEGYIPRTALTILDDLLTQAMETTDMDQPINISAEHLRRHIVTSFPDLASRFGITGDSGPVSALTSSPAPQADFSEAHFAELIADRFPQFKNPEGHIHGHFRGFVAALARLARNEWNRTGRPVTQVGGVTIPSEALVTQIVERAVQQGESQNRAGVEHLRRVYENRAESLERRGEEAAREVFRRAEAVSGR